MGNTFTRSTIPPQLSKQMLLTLSLKTPHISLPSSRAFFSSSHILSHEARRRSVRAVEAPPQGEARHPPAPRAPPARSARSSSAPLPPGSCARPHHPRPRAGLAARPLLPKLPSQKRVSPYFPKRRPPPSAPTTLLARLGTPLREKCWEIWRQGYARGVGGAYGSGPRPPLSEPRLPTRSV